MLTLHAGREELVSRDPHGLIAQGRIQSGNIDSRVNHCCTAQKMSTLRPQSVLQSESEHIFQQNEFFMLQAVIVPEDESDRVWC